MKPENNEPPERLLSNAAHWGNFDKVSEILRSNPNININYISYSGRTALHSVCRSIQGFADDRLKIVKSLLEHKADIAIPDKDGKTAFELTNHSQIREVLSDQKE